MLLSRLISSPQRLLYADQVVWRHEQICQMARALLEENDIERRAFLLERLLANADAQAQTALSILRDWAED